MSGQPAVLSCALRCADWRPSSARTLQFFVAGCWPGLQAVRDLLLASTSVGALIVSRGLYDTAQPLIGPFYAFIGVMLMLGGLMDMSHRRPKSPVRAAVDSGATNRHRAGSEFEIEQMVGARGFEPPTSSSRTMRATKLRHAPTECPTYRNVQGCRMIAHGARAGQR
jgi:hypothetical protein